MITKRSRILLVEDDANDEELTCRVLRKEALLTDIVVARDGAEALDYIFGRGAHEGRDVLDQPVVILLDLNLPKIGGLDVLKAIRADPRTQIVPVVIMTSSREDADLLRGYELGANSYVVKPVQFDEFSATVKQLGLYWLVANELPGRPTVKN
ncbi:MAG TPA: response regulator [Kineosporiaceae bacterium]|nr:response regulator [Kineosporiaceae bacterium]